MLFTHYCKVFQTFPNNFLTFDCFKSQTTLLVQIDIYAFMERRKKKKKEIGIMSTHSVAESKRFFRQLETAAKENS